MEVAETFISINGEGRRAGELAVFIRFRGCNLRCSYCDTAWANAPDCSFRDMSPEEICAFVRESGIRNVTLTGGEPLLQKDMPALLSLLEKEPRLRTEVETNGAVDLAPFCTEARPVFTMDYKLPSSGCEAGMLLTNLELLTRSDTVKFVAGSNADLDRALELIRCFDLTGRCHVYFSPVFGRIDPETIVNFLIGHRLNDVRLQLQMHKMIWDPEQRGV